MITGDMIVDYEMATPDEFIGYYSELMYPDYSELEEKVKRNDNDE